MAGRGPAEIPYTPPTDPGVTARMLAGLARHDAADLAEMLDPADRSGESVRSFVAPIARDYGAPGVARTLGVKRYVVDAIVHIA